jgi:hypothetical protein
MLDQHEIRNSLFEWLTTFVETPNNKLGNWPPCPFARKARLSDGISIKFGSFTEFDYLIKESLETLTLKEVVIICFDHTVIESALLQKYVQDKNKFLMPLNYVILEDHPDIIEHINGVNMNFKKCGLLIFQKLNKLNEASDQLKSKGYYDVWSKEELDDVVTWRQN